ncbi:translocation protein TolB [Fulvivirga sediminis]|uniref:Translocation protein TolB n=1 Tax=Fulvivirga sediminis TaxID=2803949 RepID=A0A937FA45_9BACT|nr:translocation protein TolB [Fulvivirga sediminis]MBL3657090.1 translocation protein TolB [Fulvivirga sediminis]
MIVFKKFILILGFLLYVTGGVLAQDAAEKFGRNRLQYEQFEWKFLSSDNFDIYFYEGNDKIANDVTEYLEDEFEKITDLIGYPPYSKTKIFLYNSVSDLQQSNVGIDDKSISPSGQTDFIKSSIEVANPGNIEQLKEELLYKVSSLMVNEMMFGGSLKDMFQSSVLLNLPEWFIDGAALYVAKGWSIEMDDYARELMKTKKPQKLNRLTGKEAALAGQSVWNYIAQKYGKSNISNILNYTRIIRNEERSIGITLGRSFDRVLQEWQEFYTDIDKQVAQNYEDAKSERVIIDRKNKKGIVYSYVKLSPDGTKVAYTANDNGKYEVRISNVDGKRNRKVLDGGYKVIDQEVNYEMPLIDWVDDNTLGIVRAKKGQYYFVLYDLASKSKLQRPLRKFDNIKSIDFSDNGRLWVASATIDGVNDLYLMTTKRDRIKRLMHDIYDDMNPYFLPGTNTIAFSSNRLSDTLNVETKDFAKVTDNYNIFYYNLDTTDNVVKRVTNTISSDVNPLALSSDKIFYLSDQKGIVNIFSYSLSTGIYTQVTNFSKSIKEFDINFEHNALIFTMLEGDNDYIYYYPDFDYNQQTFTPLTVRQQLEQVKAFKNRKNKERKEVLTVKEIVEKRLAEAKEEMETPADTISTPPADSITIEPIVQDEAIIDTDNYSFDSATVDVPEDDTDVVNTSNYTFDNDVVKEDQNDSFLAQYRKLRSEKKISGPFPYDNRFSADNVVTSLIIHPLMGFGVRLETGMTDMLENHKFNGGVMTNFDLRSGEVFAQYQYLKHFVDYKVRYDRSVYFFDDVFHKFVKNSFQVGASIPFSTRARLSLEPFYSQVKSLDLNNFNTSLSPNTILDPITDNYGGANVEFVYDNSTINGMNLIEGSRAKIQLKHYEGLDKKELSFTNLTADVRHYQKIYKEIVLATRVFYGRSFGNSPKQFLLGGMDNWILFDENTSGDNNPLDFTSERYNTDIIFAQYATNLRGFDYATLVGENTLVFNGELRLPLIRALSNKPISSNFFRNLQFIGFFDIGSAWTGRSPFHEDNNVSTETITQGNFTISLKNYRNPWLYSYGAGLRTMLLGYYVKVDLAWPVEDYVVDSPKIMFTLGYDF